MDRLAPRLFLLVVGVLLATLLIVLALADRASRAQALAEAHGRLEAAHGVFREQLRLRMVSQTQLTEAVGSDFGLKEEIVAATPGSVSLEVTLRNFQRRGGAAWALATDPDGRILASTTEALPADTPLPFDGVLEESGGDGSLRRVDALLHQVIATPVHAPRPLVVGWLVFGFPLDDGKMRNLEQQTGTTFSLLHARGTEMTVLASGLEARARHEMPVRLEPEEGFATLLLPGRGEDVLLVRPVDGSDGDRIHVVMQKSLSEVLEGFRRLRLQLLLTSLVALTLAAAAAWWLSRRISRPLTEMAVLARRLGDGQFDTALPANATGEVGALARALTVMQGGLRERDEALRAVAYVSGLTGLPNRSGLVDALAPMLGETPKLAVIVLDLDHFSDINDTLGHGVGDRVIDEVALRLVDAAEPGTLIAHLGGDQFALALPMADRESIERRVERITACFSKPVAVEGLSLHLGATLGAALAPDHSDSAEALLRHAESAMYRGKARRDGGLTLYDPASDHHSRQRLALMGELRGAVERGELQLHVQPKVHLGRGEVVGVECLVRWRHPVLGMIAPDRFIPLAEQTGQIRQLTAWVIDTATRHMRETADRGLSIRWAVNVSALDLLAPDFAAGVAQAMSAAGLPTGQLVVEVTESAAMTDPELAIRQLGELRRAGIKLSIDDYGTGHASMAQLKRLPVDELKIDRAFVRNLVSDAKDEAIVSSTITLAHQLGLSVVAEGVEDAATAARLAALGCDEIQGYGVARPMPVGELADWLARNRSAVRTFIGGPAA